jgi:hypothetical protein
MWWPHSKTWPYNLCDDIIPRHDFITHVLAIGLFLHTIKYKSNLPNKNIFSRLLLIIKISFICDLTVINVITIINFYLLTWYAISGIFIINVPHCAENTNNTVYSTWIKYSGKTSWNIQQYIINLNSVTTNQYHLKINII